MAETEIVIVAISRVWKGAEMKLTKSYSVATVRLIGTWSLIVVGLVNASEEPVGWWAFDEGIGKIAFDSSPSANHGDLIGDPQWVEGMLGTGLSFDGDGDYVETGFTEDLEIWTIACWVKSPSEPKHGPHTRPLCREKNYQINWDHPQPAYVGTVALRVGTTWYGASLQPLERDTWYHIVGTYDGEDLKAYRNGSLVSVNSEPSGVPSFEPRSLRIGRHAVFEDRFFTGLVYEVQIFDYPLTAGEVRGLQRGYSANEIRLRITDPNDDVEQLIDSGLVFPNSESLDLVYREAVGRGVPHGDQVVGLRFADVQLDAANITKAYLEFVVRDAAGGDGPVNLVIEGLLDPNAAPFTLDPNGVTNRLPRTVSQVKWSVPEWTVEHAKSRSPDISSIIEEIINLPGWNRGNSLMLFIRDDPNDPSQGIRVAQSFDGSPGQAPLLYVKKSPLVAYWRFDEGRGDVAYDSAGIYDGIVQGATWTTGILGKALRFDGVDDSVDCGNAAALSPEFLTISAWVKAEESSSRKSIAYKGRMLFEADFDLVLSSGIIKFEFGNEDDFVSVRSDSAITLNEWHLVSATRDGSKAAVYLDAVKESTQPYNFTPLIRDIPLIIGELRGAVDEVQIYNRALDEDEILTNCK